MNLLMLELQELLQSGEAGNKPNWELSEQEKAKDPSFGYAQKGVDISSWQDS